MCPFEVFPCNRESWEMQFSCLEQSFTELCISPLFHCVFLVVTTTTHTISVVVVVGFTWVNLMRARERVKCLLVNCLTQDSSCCSDHDWWHFYGNIDSRKGGDFGIFFVSNKNLCFVLQIFFGKVQIFGLVGIVGME